MNEWNKVKDCKLPIDRWVIGYGDDVEFILVDEFGEFFVWCDGRSPYYGSEITHWMPLPELPEQDND